MLTYPAVSGLRDIVRRASASACQIDPREVLFQPLGNFPRCSSRSARKSPQSTLAAVPTTLAKRFGVDEKVTLVRTSPAAKPGTATMHLESNHVLA